MRVSGETDDEYTKGAKVGGTITSNNTAATTGEGATANAGRTQQLEAQLKEAQTSAAQVPTILYFNYRFKIREVDILLEKKS